MAGYVRAKPRILRNQRASDWAVIGVDDEHGRALYEELAGAGASAVLPVAVGRSLDRGVYVDRRPALRCARRTRGPAVLDLRPIASLRGAHNWQNAAAAYAAARALGARARGDRRRAAAASGPRPSPGDGRPRSTACSSSTTARRPIPTRRRARSPASTASTGSPAAGPRRAASTPLLPWLDRVRHAYLIGEAAERLRRRRSRAASPARSSGDLANAVRQAAAAARARSRRQRRGPAGAGVRVVRPVPRFRSSAARRSRRLVGRSSSAARSPEGAACMMAFSRTERGLFGRWWWTVDRGSSPGSACWRLSGLVFVLASSPPVASRLGLPPLHFVARHGVVPAAGRARCCSACSLLSPTGVRRLATGLLALAPGPARADAAGRPRDQGRHALAADRRSGHPAERVPQAGAGRGGRRRSLARARGPCATRCPRCCWSPSCCFCCWRSRTSAWR